MASGTAPKSATSAPTTQPAPLATGEAVTRVARGLVGKSLAALTEKTVEGEDPPIYLDWNATTPIFPEVHAKPP